MSELLKTELETYKKEFESLLGEHDTKFVLIHRTEVLGAFDSHHDAIMAGYRQLGNVPFLVKQVLKVDSPLNFVSNLLGV